MSQPQIAPKSMAAAAIRVMIVDDAVVVRGLLSRWLSGEPDIEIVGGLSRDDTVVVNPPDSLIDRSTVRLTAAAAPKATT